jgi:outer membrane protein assembly factor BamB
MDRSFKIISLVIIVLFGTSFFAEFADAESSPIRVDWTSKLNSGKVGSKKHLNFATPTVVQGRAYVGSGGGFFYALDLKNGKKLWEVKLQGPVLSKPLFDSGTLYIGDGKGFVYSINPEDGQENWQAYIGEEVMSTPASSGGSIFVGTQSNSVFALDKSSGSIKWSVSRNLPFSSMSVKAASDPVVIDGKVYVGNTDGVLVAYSVADGKKAMTIPVSAARAVFTDIDTSPLRHEGRVLFSTMEGALYSVDYKTGREYWSKPIGTPNNIAYSEGIIFVSAGGKVYALRVESGETVWEKDLEKMALSAPAVANNYIVVVSTDDKLYLLDKASGEVALERHLGGGTFGAPVVAEGKILVLSNSNQLYAFKFQ